MQETQRFSLWMLCLGAAVVLGLGGCSGGGGGGGAVPATGSTVSPADQAAIDANLASALSTQNVVAIHDDTSSTYNSDCVSCHGSKSDGTALDGRPDAHAVMVPWTPGDTTNDKCTWCHDKIVLEFRNPSHNSYSGTYSNYLDPDLPASADQLNTARLNTNLYENGTIRQQHNAVLCLQCHALGTEFEFYAN